MDGLTLATATATCASFSGNTFFVPCVSSSTRGIRRRREVWYPRKCNLVVLAAKDDGEPKLDRRDQMELHFGRLLGDDSKLSLAKANPDASYLETEKSLYKNKGTVVEMEELPFDISDEEKLSNSLDDLNSLRPVPKGGIKFQADEEKPKAPEIKKPVRNAMDSTMHRVPNVFLRKPPVFIEDNVQDEPSRTLKLNARNNQNMGCSLKKPETIKNDIEESSKTVDGSFAKEQQLEDESVLRMHSLNKSNAAEEKISINECFDANLVDSSVEFFVEAELQGKPKRLDQSVKEPSISSIDDTILFNPGRHANANELKDLPSTSPLEDADWTKAAYLLKTGKRVEVELISSSTTGFVVSFASLIGFLPYRYFAAKWKFPALESWLRMQGLDPAMYKQNIGIIRSYDVSDKNPSLQSRTGQETDKKLEVEITRNMKLEDLCRIYDQERLQFFSSFVGQRIKVNVITVDPKLRKLIVSLRPKEKEELVEKKRNLMAKLQVGDVVKCCIKKINYIGIFVEVEDVPALIHHSKISWDITSGAASYFKVGQILDAKVHELDFTLERISLSLNGISPDQLTGASESGC